ncbi:MAG TPA: TetR/AcrR family transcriptional regulator, partial [Acidimicrobiales bacterium]|nr:TetR/AcrR family transcriptional regulator [Acidimicrobiales bacterium]
MATPEVSTSTKEAILVEARRCFAEQGFEGTSLNDIAAGVGIRKPSLLHHFPSKEAIYREVFETSLSDWIVRIETAGDKEGQEPWEKMEFVLDTAFDWFCANPEFVRI